MMHKKQLEKQAKKHRVIVDSAMPYRELDKKYDDFYEKLLVKCTKYAIINIDRRKPSKCAQWVRQKTVPSNYRSFPASTHDFNTERRECRVG
jgi:hypothetical protein